MRISVKAIPVHEVMNDLANQWQVPLVENCGEMSLELPEDLGKGRIKGMGFESGIGIINYECKFHSDYEILFSVKQNHPLKFIFSSVGSVNHSFEGDDVLREIKTYQNVVVSSSGTKGHLLQFKAGEKNNILSIEIVRSVFSKRKNHDFSDLDPVLGALFRDAAAVKNFVYQGNYCIKAADIVDEIYRNNYEGMLRSVFMEGKILEMLVTQIRQYQDDHREDEMPQMIRTSDMEKVKMAAELINVQMDKNFSVEHLANEVGTNVNKLQEGFKQLYGLTVNKYAQEVKLKAARELLISSELSVAEVVTSIGLNNASYFSRIFREKYGMNPGFFQKPG